MLSILAVCLIAAGPPDGPFAADDQTLLLAPFDQSLTADVAGGVSQPGGVAGLAPGRFGQAAVLRPGLALSADGVRLPFSPLTWPVAGNLDPRRGTLEFWFQPAFGDAPPAEGQRLHYLFDCRRGTAEGVVLVVLEAASGRRTLQGWEKVGEVPEQGLQADVSDWAPGSWHHVALCWDGPRRALWVDGERQAQHESGPDTLTVVGDVLRFGGVAWTGHEADGLLDELRLSAQVRYED